MVKFISVQDNSEKLYELINKGVLHYPCYWIKECNPAVTYYAMDNKKIIGVVSYELYRMSGERAVKTIEFTALLHFLDVCEGYEYARERIIDGIFKQKNITVNCKKVITCVTGEIPVLEKDYWSEMGAICDKSHYKTDLVNYNLTRSDFNKYWRRVRNGEKQVNCN